MFIFQYEVCLNPKQLNLVCQKVKKIVHCCLHEGEIFTFAEMYLKTQCIQKKILNCLGI